MARLRRVHGILVKRVRRFRRSYAARNSAPPAPNLLNRDFTADRPNRVWVTDITLEVFYNRQRIHQALGFKSPVNFEAMADVA